MNIIFPPITPQYPYEKTPIFNTMVKRSASRREYRATYWPASPLWEISVSLDGISREDMMALGGFLVVVRGALHSFFFKDAAPRITGEQSVQGIYNTNFQIYDSMANIGNGIQTEFQLFRNWNWWYLEYPSFPPFPPTGYGVGGLWGDSSGGGEGEEGFGVPVWETPMIYFDGDLQENDSNSICQYTISRTGLVTFDPAPPPGTVITADFNFFYKCRFKEDYAKLRRMAPELSGPDSVAWQLAESLVLVTVDP